MTIVYVGIDLAKNVFAVHGAYSSEVGTPFRCMPVRDSGVMPVRDSGVMPVRATGMGRVVDRRVVRQALGAFFLRIDSPCSSTR